MRNSLRKAHRRPELTTGRASAATEGRFSERDRQRKAEARHARAVGAEAHGRDRQGEAELQPRPLEHGDRGRGEAPPRAAPPGRSRARRRSRKSPPAARSSRSARARAGPRAASRPVAARPRRSARPPAARGRRISAWRRWRKRAAARIAKPASAEEARRAEAEEKAKAAARAQAASPDPRQRRSLRPSRRTVARRARAGTAPAAPSLELARDPSMPAPRRFSPVARPDIPKPQPKPEPAPRRCRCRCRARAARRPGRASAAQWSGDPAQRAPGQAAAARPQAATSAARGKLTVNRALGGEDGARARSPRRAEACARKGTSPHGGPREPQAKQVRDVQVPEAITVQELANRMAEKGARPGQGAVQDGSARRDDADDRPGHRRAAGDRIRPQHRARVATATSISRFDTGRGRRGIEAAASAGGHDHGPCRSRQDQPARRAARHFGDARARAAASPSISARIRLR